MSCKAFAFALGERPSTLAQFEYGHEQVPLERAKRWALMLGLPAATFVTPVLQDLVDDVDEFEGGIRVRVRCEET